MSGLEVSALFLPLKPPVMAWPTVWPTAEPTATPAAVVAIWATRPGCQGKQQVSPQQMVELAPVAELLVLAWAQFSSDVPCWPEQPCGRCSFGFHVAGQLQLCIYKYSNFFWSCRAFTEGVLFHNFILIPCGKNWKIMHVFCRYFRQILMIVYTLKKFILGIWKRRVTQNSELCVSRIKLWIVSLPSLLFKIYFSITVGMQCYISFRLPRLF